MERAALVRRSNSVSLANTMTTVGTARATKANSIFFIETPPLTGFYKYSMFEPKSQISFYCNKKAPRTRVRGGYETKELVTVAGRGTVPMTHRSARQGTKQYQHGSRG